jgi:hypothetical protein
MNCRQKPRQGRTWIWVVIALILLPLLGIAIFHLMTGRALEKRMNAVRAQGLPITLDELDASYTIPPDVENAADLYLDAFNNLVKWSGEDKERLPLVGNASLPARTAAISEPNQILIREYLADNQETLKILHEAASLPHARYPVDLSQGFDSLTPWLSQVRQCARLLQLQALMHVEQDDPNQALNSVRSGLALAQSLKSPILIDYLVRIAASAMQLQTLERIMCRSSLTHEQLESMAKLVHDPQAAFSIKYALIGERCTGLSVFRMPLRAMNGMAVSDNPMPRLVLGPMRAVGLLKREAVGYLDIMQDYIQATDLPAPEGVATAKGIAQAVERGQRGGFLTRMFAPALGRVMELESRAQAHRLVAYCALAVEQYRLGTGELPESLDKLVPQYLDTVPLDPFDGQPLRYRLLNQGFVVYSIGEDLSDDGGQEKGKRKRGSGKRQPWDVTFFVER